VKDNITLSRDLNLLDITSIGVGAMIGAGIFVLTGIAAGLAGPALLLAFLLNGAVTAITAASYAELGSCFPEAGGGYLWVKEAIGGLAGFLSGWMSWFAHAVACSVYALGFGAYLAELVINLGLFGESPRLLEKPFAVGIAVLFAYINYRGAKETGRTGNLIVLTKIVILGVFVAFGLAALVGKPGWPSHFTPFFPNGAGGVIAAMGLTFIAFEGYEIIVQSGEEVKNPRRNIPRAIFLSIAISLTIYLFVAFVALAAIDGHGRPTWQYLGAAGETAMVEAARQLLPGGAVLLIVGGLMSTMSALNATIYSSSRVSFAMGRDRVLPDALAAIHPKRHTPYHAVTVSAVLVVAMAVALPIKDVAAAADVMFLLLFALVNASTIALRHKRPDLERGFCVPLMPTLPILGIILTVGLAVYLFTISPGAWASAAIWIGVGAGTYYLYVARREALPRAPIVEAQVELTRAFRVLLPIAKPERADQLAPLAAALASASDGEVLAMYTEVVPRQLPLSNGWRIAEQAWQLVERAREIVAAAGVPAHSMIRVSHDAALGIIAAAREIEANVIIMGWRPTPSTRDRLLGPTLGRLLSDPPCNILVVRAGTFQAAHRILVPLAGGPNATLAARYALRLAERWDAQVTAITVVDQRATKAEREATEKMLRDALGQDAKHPRLAIHLVAAPGPLAGIQGATAGHDLIMIGASREGVIDRALFGDVPEQVATTVDIPVIIVKRPVGPVTGWARRALDRVSGWLPQLSDEQRVAAYKSIRRSARPDIDYFVMTGLAAGIAALGLLLDSPAVIIGAMLVAPLMAAIVGLGMGIVMGDLRLLRLGASATLRGALLAIGIGMLGGWLAFGAPPTAEIVSRTHPTLLDLGVALLSGAAGAYALCREDVSAALPGVAIAAALVPPLATVGIGLSSGDLTVWGGALALFLANLIAITAASAVVFLLFGYRPAPGNERITILRRGVLSTIALLAIVAVILGSLTVNLINQASLNREVRAAVAAEVARLDHAELVEVNIAALSQRGVHLDITIRSPFGVSYQQTVDLQKGIAERLNRTVELVLTVVPVTQLNPFVPPTPTPTPTPTWTPTPSPTPAPGPTPTSTMTPTATWTPVPTPTRPPSPTPTASPTATPTPTSTPSATPTPTPTLTPVISGVIANTGGRGVRVRASPGGKTVAVWTEGTRVTIVAGPESVQGQAWLRVRDDKGIEGWVAADYILLNP
jgi:uncharacterized hydrophobic protein (TIGR00271 family)